MIAMNIKRYVKNSFLKIIVKTNTPKTEVTGYDKTKNAVKVNVKASPVDGKANTEIIKFFSKQLNKKVEIKNGKSSKEKLLRVY